LIFRFILVAVIAKKKKRGWIAALHQAEFGQEETLSPDV
jgi:hypothetical protein